MSDVARLAGVSIKTVSRVVNAEPGVHADTADRVLAAIERLGFRRNVGALNLRRGSSTGTIGLVLEDVANPFYSGLTRAAEKVARRFGRQVLTGSSDEDAGRERELALEFCARRVDGLIIVPAGRQHGYLLPEITSGTPVVFVDRPPGDVVADTVLVDNVAGAALAVAHLAAHGHRRSRSSATRPRSSPPPSASPASARAARGPASPSTSGSSPWARTPSETISGHARGRTPPPSSPETTGSPCWSCARCGLEHRPALVGFDDFELADLLDPPVTVVSLDPAELGKAAAELLFARLDGDRHHPAGSCCRPV